MNHTGKNLPLELRCRQLEEDLAAQKSETARLQKENQLLREKIDLLIRKLFGPSSEKHHPDQLELLLEGLATHTPEPPAPSPLFEQERTPVKPQRPRRETRERVPEHLPAVEEILVPAEVAADPSKWRRIGEERTELLDCDPARYYRRVYIREKYVSLEDKDAAPLIAPLPPLPQERCIAAPGLLASIAVAKYCDHLPLYRQESILRTRHGIDLPRATLARWMELVAFWLEPIYRHLRNEIFQGGYIQIDETPIKYLDPGNGKTAQGYLWTVHAPKGDVLFHWETSRAASCLETLVPKNFTGILQCDAYAAYASFAAKRPGIELVGCWAHARRNFCNSGEHTPVRSGWMLKQIANLYAIESHLRRTTACPKLREVQRTAQSRPILARIQRALQKMAASGLHLPQSLFAKAIAYTLDNWKELTAYTANGRIEIDNNLVENAIRPTALGKKNWLFIGHADAGQRSAILYTVIESCRRRGIDPHAYLRDVLTRLPGATNKMIPEFTPAAWAKARQPVPKAA